MWDALVMLSHQPQLGSRRAGIWAGQCHKFSGQQWVQTLFNQPGLDLVWGFIKK